MAPGTRGFSVLQGCVSHCRAPQYIVCGLLTATGPHKCLHLPTGCMGPCTRLRTAVYLATLMLVRSGHFVPFCFPCFPLFFTSVNIIRPDDYLKMFLPSFFGCHLILNFTSLNAWQDSRFLWLSEFGRASYSGYNRRADLQKQHHLNGAALITTERTRNSCIQWERSRKAFSLGWGTAVN